MVSKTLLVLIVALFVVAFALDNKKDAKVEKLVSAPAKAVADVKKVGKAKKEYYGEEYGNEEDGYGPDYEERPYGDEHHEERPYGDEHHDERPYGEERPHEEHHDERPYGDEHHDERPYGDERPHEEFHDERPYGDEHHEERPHEEHHDERPSYGEERPQEFNGYNDHKEHHDEKPFQKPYHHKEFDDSKFQKVKICTYANQDTLCLYPVACQTVFSAQCFNLHNGNSAMIFTGSAGVTFYIYHNQDCGAHGTTAYSPEVVQPNQCQLLDFGSNPVYTSVFTLYSVSK